VVAEEAAPRRRCCGGSGALPRRESISFQAADGSVPQLLAQLGNNHITRERFINGYIINYSNRQLLTCTYLSDLIMILELAR
jgi:hypothetical protein